MARRDRPHALADAELQQLIRDLGDGVRTIRMAAGMSQDVMSSRTSLSQGDISDLELGKRIATLSTLWRIARVCGVDLRITFVQRD